MKQKLLLKSMLLLFALIAGSSSVWAETATITFANQTTGTSDSGTELTTSTFVSDGIASCGTDFGTITCSATAKCYKGKVDHGLKTGASSSAGSFTISFSTALTNVSQITINRASYNSSKTATITVKNGETTLGSTNTPSSSADFADMNITGLSISSLSGLTINTSRYCYIKSITITYSKTSTPVTGVSLNKAATTLTAGETEQLIATITPENASNKNVTWESDDESVATVDADGIVTAVAKGTAQITATTTEGGFTATCDVTVTPAPPATVTLDFTSNDVWGFPTSGTNTAAHSYTSGGYTITLAAPNNYYFDSSSNNLFLGKEGATLTLPAFSFNVNKIKIYGTDGASGSVTFNVYVGETAVSTSATSSKVTHEFAIAADKQAAGNIYVIKVTNNNNMRITKIEIFGYTTATIAGSGYSTIAFGCGLDFSSATPAGLEAYIVPSITASAVSLSAIDEAPASTGVILKGTAGETYSIPVKAGAAAIVGTNKLQAAVAATPIAANSAYILQGGLFHKVTAASTVPAGKAYLLASDVPASAPVLDFGFDDATGINAVNGEGFTVIGEFYNLNGQRVAQPTKGLYIVNGKKVVIK